jgi:4-alpha-glucanotransferase
MTCPTLRTRSAGILLHPSSLAGPLPSGDLGPEAYKFVDFLAAAKVAFWQMLPIHPIGAGDSPYDSPSAFAGAPHLISLEELVKDGLLTSAELTEATQTTGHRQLGPRKADLAQGLATRTLWLRRAFGRFTESSNGGALRGEYEAYLAREAPWVYDFCLYLSIKAKLGPTTWLGFPAELRRREFVALERAQRELSSEVNYRLFEQFCFDRQWTRLREYAHKSGVSLMGDIPMFVAHDSVDVWANQHMFFLDERGERTVQAGVPPDYFSEDGQLWGNPLYRWETMRADGFGWWVDRLRRELRRFDVVRLDHFIAFSRYWEIPVPATSAKGGRYVEVPGYDFFGKVRQELGSLPFVAEDLGILTKEVESLRDHFELPGMRVLQFAFSPGAESYLPYRHPASSVVYTGTHDNDTTVGYVNATLDAVARGNASAAVELGRLEAWTGTRDPVLATSALVRALFASPSNTAILPMQDVLRLDTAHRMNVPGTSQGNWAFRLLPGDLDLSRAHELAALALATGRAQT